MKYAILDSGGKQYIAREGETIEVDRLPHEIGKSVEFKEVLLVADNGDIAVGTPTIKGASVKGRVLDHIKAAKIIVFKYVPKQRYRRKQGHRQRYTRVSIEQISVTSPAKKKAVPKEEGEKVTKTKAEPKAAAKEPKPKAKPAAKKTAARKTTAKKADTAKSEAKTSGKAAASKKTASKSASTKKTASKSKEAAPKKTAEKPKKKPSTKKSSSTKN